MSPVPLASTYRCAYSPVKFVFVDNHFCVGSGVGPFLCVRTVYKREPFAMQMKAWVYHVKQNGRHMTNHDNGRAVDCLCSFILHHISKDNKTMKTLWQKWLGMNDLGCSLHRQTAVNVGFTDRELKLLHPSELSSNPSDYFHETTLRHRTWELIYLYKQAKLPRQHSVVCNYGVLMC